MAAKCNDAALDILSPFDDIPDISWATQMITGPQIRAARALLGIDQKDLARLSGLSTPTIQRMEACEGSVRSVVDSLEKVIAAFTAAGVELIGEGGPSQGQGRGVRLIAKR